MTAMDLLIWSRGTGLQIALAVFILGSLFRVLGIFMLGRKQDLSRPRGGMWGPGLKTIVRRSWADGGTLRRTPLTYFGGYIFHVGFLLTLLFYAPHVLFFESVLGFGWPALPALVVEILAILSIGALVALLVHRIVDPVRRLLSSVQDYYSWAVTILPLLTGYWALNAGGANYTFALALHILSFELLLVSIPFTKLIHTFTFLIARWYNGAIAGRRGVEA